MCGAANVPLVGGVDERPSRALPQASCGNDERDAEDEPAAVQSSTHLHTLKIAWPCSEWSTLSWM